MWTGPGDVSSGGGGFDVSGYGSPSAGATDQRTPRKASSVFPVTVRQVLESSDELVIAGYPASMMTIVGIIRSAEITSTKIVCTVQDWSGTITAMLWLEEGADDQKSNVVENTYCRMTGTKRMHEGSACLFIYNITPVENLMELTYHYLQVLHIPRKAEELRTTNEDRMAVTFDGDQTNQTSLMKFSVPDGLTLPPHQMKVYRALQNCRSEPGMNKQEIFDMLEQKLSIQEIDKILDFLMAEGHVYNTIDDCHFKITDA